LGELILSSGSLGPQLTLDILRQVAAALVKSSGENIVHRDIKPENIMLARSGEVKVADFGLARVQGDGTANFTQIGVTMGTPLYMSPEQIEGRPLDSRSDIYSLGVTAYHMLAGQPPFTGDTPLAVAVQHLNQSPPPLASRRPDVPPRLAALVERMMAKRPDDRFADPATLLVELNALTREGAQQGWAAGLDPESLSQILQAADQRSAATTRLDQLMKTTALVRPKRPAAQWLAVAAIACILAGAGVAALTGPRSLLAGAALGPPKAKDVWSQLYQAKQVDTEAAWRAVATHFKDADAYCLSLAQQGLVYHFFRAHEYEKAIEPLEKLAATTDTEFKLFGIAGLVVAFTNLDDDKAALAEYGRLTAEMKTTLAARSPTMSALLSDALDELADRALQRN
jgi:serine/threonine-protein kinase